jgi:hypothetical protein
MTGPENYKEAERLVTASRGQELDCAAVTIAEAQVYATLALAAATALGLDAPPREYDAWYAVCGVKRS